MTPSTRSEAERIAAGLSEACQKRLAEWSPMPGTPDGAIGDLADKGLIDVFVRKDAAGLVIAWNWIPTAAGLAVRTLLQETK